MIATDKIKVTQIMIHRAEGPTEKCVKRLFTDWASAEAHISNICYSIRPGRPGYDKCDFSITYADGMVYSGRFDAKNPMDEQQSLASHIREHLQFLAGEKCPRHITTEQYDRLLAEYKCTEAAKHLLESYQIGVRT
jgi:hypothetical protein